jgi:hypothetical protein
MALLVVTNMTHDFVMAKVQALNTDVEEEVTLDVDGLVVVGFASNRPALRVGDSRKVQLKLFTATDYGLTPASSDSSPSITRVGTGFGYRIVGTMVEQGVSVGAVTLQDESLPTDFTYLMGEKVSLVVDRIGVSFSKV